MKNGIIIISALLIISQLYAELVKAKNIVFKIISLKPDLAGASKYLFQQLPINVKIKLTNASGLQATINTINLRIFLNNKQIGAVTKTDKFTIEGKQDTIFTLEVLVDVLNLGLNIGSIVSLLTTGKTITTDVEVKGFIDSSMGRLIVNEKIYG